MPAPVCMPRFTTISTQVENGDQPEWPARMIVETYGLHIGLRANTPQALDRARTCLPPLWTPTDSPVVDEWYSLALGEESSSGAPGFSTAYKGAVRVARTLDRDEVIGAFESALNLHVAEFASNCLFVHAGVVGWRGHAIVLPGPSYAGKSTLVAALLRAGATYYSDEFAVFDTDGRVHPFPRLLSLRGQPGTRPRRVTSLELGAPAGVAPLPVGLVALARYKPGAHWRPRIRTAGQGVLHLLANTVAARREPARAFTTLGRVTAQARIVAGTRGAADEAAEWLLQSATTFIDGKGAEDRDA